MTSGPDGTIQNNDDDGNSEETVRGEHAVPESTQTGFDETVIQGSQFKDLTEQFAPKSMLGQFGRYMIQGKLGEG